MKVISQLMEVPAMEMISILNMKGSKIPKMLSLNQFLNSQKKIMVWLAISKKGRSLPFIAEWGNAVDANRYIDNSLKSKHKKFIDKSHSDGKYYFWPDLATAHYANDTMNGYEMLGIKVLPKDQNTPCVPQLRPME
jgi:hypothetical protein